MEDGGFLEVFIFPHNCSGIWVRGALRHKWVKGALFYPFLRRLHSPQNWLPSYLPLLINSDANNDALSRLLHYKNCLVSFVYFTEVVRMLAESGHLFRILVSSFLCSDKCEGFSSLVPGSFCEWKDRIVQLALQRTFLAKLWKLPAITVKVGKYARESAICYNLVETEGERFDWIKLTQAAVAKCLCLDWNFPLPYFSFFPCSIFSVLFFYSLFHSSFPLFLIHPFSPLSPSFCSHLLYEI